MEKANETTNMMANVGSSNDKYFGSISITVCILRGSEANSLVCSVVDGVVALQEEVTIDEVESLARVGANVGDDKVYGVGISTNIGVKRAWPDLSVRDKLESLLIVRLGLGRHPLTPPITNVKLFKLLY
jgi:hypothetical protein